MGFKDVQVDDLVELNIHHVTTRFIRDVREKLGEDLTLEQILDIRMNGIDEDLMEALQSAGVKIKKNVKVRA
jgi:hypothetical protein